MAVITISRQYGSGGNQIAALLEDRLGYRFFDKGLMAQLGVETGLISEEAAEAAEAAEAEPPTAGLLHRFLGLQPRGGAVVWTFGNKADAYKQMSPELTNKLILAAYEHDNVILL